MTRSIIEGEKTAIGGILILLMLGFAKLLVGLYTGMTVILADATSTFSDTLSLFAAYLGLRISRKSADGHFKYGYYKIESFMALLISLGTVYVGYLIILRSFHTFNSSPPGQHRIFAVSISVLAIVVSYFLYRKLKNAGEKLNSLSLLASATDKKLDIYAGLVVLISIIANYFSIPYFEGIVSGILALTILKAGLYNSKESLFFLLDYWNDPILSRRIKKILGQDKDLILKVKNLKLRRAGTVIFGQGFVEVNPFAGIEEVREEMEFLQRRIQDLNPYIKDFVIYSHIPKSKKIKIGIPIKEGSSLNSRVAATLKSTSAYLFIEINNNQIKKVYCRKLDYTQKSPVKFGEFLKNEKVNVIIDNRLNSLIYYNLRRTNHILIYPNFSDINIAKDVMKLFLNENQ